MTPVRAGEASSGNFVEGLWKDFRYALRSMRKNPVFVLFVVLTLALGNRREHHGLHADQYADLESAARPQSRSNWRRVTAADSRNTANSGVHLPASRTPTCKDYQSRNEVFDSLAGYSSARGMTWLNHGASEAASSAELVTANYFSTFGLSPARGRFFAPEEDGAPGRPPGRGSQLCHVAETLRRRGGHRGPGA